MTEQDARRTTQEDTDPYRPVIEALSKGLIVAVNWSLEEGWESDEMVVQRVTAGVSGPIVELKSGDDWYQIQRDNSGGWDLAQIVDDGRPTRHKQIITLEVLGIK